MKEQDLLVQIKKSRRSLTWMKSALYPVLATEPRRNSNGQGHAVREGKQAVPCGVNGFGL